MSRTTDPTARSFVESAPGSLFPIQNLPYGVFTPPGSARAHVGIAIGDRVFCLTMAEEHGLLADALGTSAEARPFATGSLNAFMALGPDVWQAVRERAHDLLRADTATLRDDADLQANVFHDRAAVTMHLPAQIGDYTDFYSSKEHATNVGTMFRGPENALMPNWLHLPVGYHGRASSVVPSGTPVRRPCGQTKPEDGAPVYGPSRLMDFELEMGFFTGPGNALGTPIPIGEAERHVFGLALVNDWSARDIQKWEYQPLGPFLGKSFATTVSPWVVPLAALEPFRIPSQPREVPVLDYLRQDGPGSFDVALEVAIRPEGGELAVVSRSNLRYLYWSMAQQLAHHTANGCNIRPGDLLASGTISGTTPESYGSMLELTWRGSKPLTLADGSTRKFLVDGDTVVMMGVAEKDGVRIGFGEASGTLIPARCE